MGDKRASRSDDIEPADVICTAVRRVFAGSVTALAEIDLTVPQGSFVALLGPSGCGKSTLLRLIAGLDQPTSGTIEVGGAKAGDRRCPIAFVFQDAHLMPWRNVLDNTALPLELAGVGKALRHEAARSVLSDVGLADAMTRIPAELSGGMRMRVSLARALITKPRLLLLDEPFGALDELTRNRLDDRLHELWCERGTTVIFVTHSITEAAYLAQRALVFSRRPARIVADLSLDLPAVRTRDLRSSGAFLAEVQKLQDALERADEQ